MGMNLHSLLMLQQRGFISSKNNKILNIGPENIYCTNENEIHQFLHGQGIVEGGDALAKQLKNDQNSPPRPEEKATIFSDITVLAGIEYCRFDVCPAPYTELVDLNFVRRVFVITLTWY